MQEYDPLPPLQHLISRHVEKGEDGYRARGGGERRESLYCVRVGKEVLGWRGGFFYEGLSFGEEEAFGFAVFLLFEFGKLFENSGGDHTSEESSNLSSSFLGPPTTKTSPFWSGVSGCGKKVPSCPSPFIASMVR